MTFSVDSGERITRDSLEDVFRGLQSDVDRAAPSRLVKVAYAAGGLATALIGLAYLAGRRAGRKRSTIVEVRRI